MSIKVEDFTGADVSDLEERRSDEERRAAMAEALYTGNESLIFAFEALALAVEQAALNDELDKVEAALGCIDQLVELGYGGGRG